jgi:predicted transcriptional regulator
MMGRNLRRNRTEIVTDILEIVREGRRHGIDGGVGKTAIMCRASLSYSQLKEYLRILTDNDLISYDIETMGFKTTEKGLRMIDAYNHLTQLISRKQKQHELIWIC